VGFRVVHLSNFSDETDTRRVWSNLGVGGPRACYLPGTETVTGILRVRVFPLDLFRRLKDQLHFRVPCKLFFSARPRSRGSWG
jgi:hypothetical protein